MTVTSHIAEILRQGIWASLTGGWYYEPSHSIFCNTAHLYLWLVLFVTPFVVGLATSGTLSVGVLVAYTVFIGLLFTVLKAIVSYLHTIFDNSEPLVTTQKTISEGKEKSEEPAVMETPGSGIELQELRRDLRSDNRARTRLIDIANARQAARRRVRIELEPLNDPPSLDLNDVEVELREHGTIGGQFVSVDQRQRIEKALQRYEQPLKEGDEENADRKCLEPPSESVSKSDELQLSPDSVNDVGRIEESSATKSDEMPSIRRKLSEPLLPAGMEHWSHKRRRSSDGIEARFRRANSTFEPHQAAEKGMLSRTSLINARENTNKSYPSKMCSDEEFYSRKLVKKQALATSSTIDDNDSELDLEVQQYWQDSHTNVLEPEAARPEPPRRQSTNVRRPGTPIEPMFVLGRETDADTPSTSSAWMPVVVSLESRRPRASFSEEDRPGPSGLSSNEVSTSQDIKGEITKFLEDLIEKHPETLDAIETVRSRMGRTKPHTSILKTSGPRRRSPSSAVTTLSDLVTRDGTHVANGHEDTTQGAVHSFQDEDGNWWTYAFDERGIGTAQPLGSGSAVLEMLNRERSTDTNSANVARTILDVLPESAYASSDEDENNQEQERPGPCLDVVPTTRRERALSSSSNESYTYIPAVPTAVFHASTTNSGRSVRGSQLVSFVNVASRLRSVIRQSSEERQREHVLELMDGTGRNSDTLQNRFADMQEIRTRLRLDSASTSSSTRRLFQELGLGQAYAATRYPPATAAPRECARRPSVKKNYYYQMKMFPRTKKQFKLKVDRLVVSTLLDRNLSVLSCIFDISLAISVAILACFVVSTGIYYDLSLVAFAFVVAGSHFSLLKSVQPDAASPIHGFNWLVAYNRPIYFCILSSLLLIVDCYADDSQNHKISWNWNLYRLKEANGDMMILAARDAISMFILLLPVCFTLGWLPQVNTLTHHVLEQVEMHIFGGTASLGPLSAAFQLAKSIVAWIFLVAVCHFAKIMNPESTQSLSFAAFAACCVGLSYLLSRFSSNQQLTLMVGRSIWSTIKQTFNGCFGRQNEEVEEIESEMSIVDPLPAILRQTVALRARHDFLYAMFISLGIFALHCTSMFSVAKPVFQYVALATCVSISIYNHYFFPQFRSHTPWKLLAKPVFRAAEFDMFETTKEARLMLFEKVGVWLQAVERNLCYPLLIVSVLSDGIWGLPWATWFGPLTALRLLRGGFCQPKLIFVPILLAFVGTHFDFSVPETYLGGISQSSWFLLVSYLLVVIYPKWLELYLKISFIMAYVAPWQISWGSAFHAFAQPFSVPHSALIWVQTIISSIISAPLNPLLGSSFFILSYVRPVKFWERDYNTKRTDASNTRLSTQIDRGPMLDDSNLNAVFYEHLTRSLQKSLAGDLLLGRWASSVEPGDCFILASFYLNCLVHIVEVGNGFVTFQLRGLEFRGTYCHQREVEAISEDQTEGAGFCCCSPGSLPGFLSLNSAWGLRWLAWEVVTGKYVIDGYSITDNSAVNLLQVHELRRLLVTLYTKCIIYYATVSSKLSMWLQNETIREQVILISETDNYVDLDHMFCHTNDDDYDSGASGISRTSFCEVYLEWISFCLSERNDRTDEMESKTEHIVSLCYILSLLGRRTLGTAAHNRHSTAAESFLYGLHALFKGDFRIQCSRDEWVFADMDLLRVVISPAVKMALKLHQDHFAATDDFDDAESLFHLIKHHESNLFISHEHDPAWRRAILANTNSLLALRHVYDDGQDDYKIIMLNKMYLNMRVIKLNRECVRSFWAGQQQELIFLRNRNPERGSIQNARQVLRNMINSSADQPVGYPIFVSPLTTSFVDTHAQVSKIVGPTITVETVFNVFARGWRCLRQHMGPSTSSSLGQTVCPVLPPPSFNPNPHPQDLDETGSQSSGNGHVENSVVHMTPSGARVTLARRSHEASNKRLSTDSPATRSAAGKSSERTSISSDDQKRRSSLTESIANSLWVEITDLDQVFRYLSEPLKSTKQPLVEWPSEELRRMAMPNPNVLLTKGLRGRVVHSWFPNHVNRSMRSHIGDVIHLVVFDWLSLPNGKAALAVSERGCRIIDYSDIPQSADRSSVLEVDSVSQGSVIRDGAQYSES